MVMNRKILIFGDKGCGKRSLVSAFKYGRFIPDQHELLYDTYVTDIPINGKMVPIDIDIDYSANKEDIRYHRDPSLNRIVNIAIICYSVDSPYSLANALEKWAPEVRHYFNRCSIILVACKIDLRTNSEKFDSKLVTSDTGRQIAREIKADVYMECSAKNDIGIDDVFTQAARLTLNKRTTKQSCVRCVLQ